ncbi:hypothetical protein SK128_011355 [Halocaridina rubra]|uniref:separase n=1 Tax=Halocaridina rubra TaxID=373956 RepID=A0AAN9AHP3_HALRR
MPDSYTCSTIHVKTSLLSANFHLIHTVAIHSTTPLYQLCHTLSLNKFWLLNRGYVIFFNHSDWTVVQITVQSNDETHFRKIGSPLPTPPLYIARCSCGPKPTVTLQVVPSPHREGVRGIIQEMGLIKQENKLITKDYRDQQEKYWEKREEMVNRLKCVVRSMDAAWLRYWCCLLLGGLEPRDQKILEDTTTHILSSLKISLTSHQHLLLQCLISCPDPDQRAVSYEGGLTLCLQAGIAAVLGESVRSSRVKDVYNAVKNEKATLDKLRTAERNPIILILDKDIVSLPWEMTWVLQNQAVTRMPSLRMLYILYQHHSCKSDSVLVKGINPNRAFYVLDPENNLPRTRKRLEGILDETGWPGVTAQTPSHEIFKEALSNQDMFVYIGHGSGSKYMPGEIVESAECRAVVLLYGCSSVGLLPNGQIPDPWGAVMNYLVAYCPCVIGMLWDVTDKETDMLTMEMLQTMRGLSTAEGTTMENPPSDLPLLVSQARSKRNWYFSRAALSVYGLPLHIAHNFDS